MSYTRLDPTVLMFELPKRLVMEPFKQRDCLRILFGL
jgi:hypothetical protein